MEVIGIGYIARCKSSALLPITLALLRNGIRKLVTQLSYIPAIFLAPFPTI